MALLKLGVLVWLLASCSSARAQARADLTPAPSTPVESRWSLGVRGFGGALRAAHEWRGGGGGGALVGFGIVPERWELELGISYIAARYRSLGVLELIGKRTFEHPGSWAPHALLGPAFSLDFGDGVATSGGLLAGVGLTHWFATRLGWTGIAAYRLLLGSETQQVFTLALGLTFRLGRATRSER